MVAMIQLNIRVCPELLKKFKEKADKGWGSQRKALEDGIKLYLWRKGEFAALTDQKGVVMLDEVEAMVKRGECFSIAPVCGEWREEEKKALAGLAASHLRENPPDKLVFSNPEEGAEEEGGVEGLVEAFLGGRHVWATWGNRETTGMPSNLLWPKKILVLTGTEFSLEA